MRRRWGAGFSALAMVVVTVGVPAAADPTSLHPCAEAAQRCDGTIAVPLDWRDPSAGSIEVAFAWVPRRDAGRPATGTVVAQPGGPTAILGTVDLIASVLGPVLDRQNLLVVEPRGFGRSSALSCPGLDLDDAASIRACAALIGDRAPHFGAAQAVDDIDAVRRALGVPKVSFYGNSYGTVLGQAYAARHPDSVRSMFLDSVVGTDRDGFTTLLAFDEVDTALDNLEVACAPSPTCRRLPGDGRDRWTALVGALHRHPDPRAPPRVLHDLTVFLGFTPRGRETNAAAVAYLAGDPAPLYRLVAEASPSASLEAQGDEAGFLAFMCADSAVPFDRTADPATRRAQFERHLRRIRPYDPYTREEITGGTPDGPEQCLDWPMRADTAPIPRSARFSDAPAYLLAGTFDVSTTPADARSVAARFPDARTMIVRFGDHSTTLLHQSTTGDCSRAELRRFLPRPGGAAGRCAAETYRALGSFPVTAGQLPLPAGSDLSPADRRAIAVGFATAADLVVRRDPRSRVVASRLLGLRGGEVVFDDAARTIQLRAVRYVSDHAVDGTIRYDPTTGRTAAELTLPDGRALGLAWTAFRAEDTTAVTGTLDGRPFTVHIGHS